MSLVVDISLARGGFALRAVATAPPGVTALFGPSGCGKTTLLRAIAGLTPIQGQIALDGAVWQDGAGALPVHKRRVGFVFQDTRLFDHLSVAGNLRYALRRAAAPVDMAAVVDQLDLGPLLAQRPATLSGGERQRVALGRALLSAPQVLALDEPLSALDGRRRQEILPYLERIAAQAQIPMLYVTHDVQEVLRLADHLWVMEAGAIVAQGAAEQVLADPHAAARLGRALAGAFVWGKVLGYDAGDDLTEVAVGAGRLWLMGRVGALGARLRLRVPAHEVMLAQDPPQGLSALSHLPVTVTELVPGAGAEVTVALVSGEARLLARVTRRSVRALGLRPGAQLHAVFKTTAPGA